MTDSTGEIEIPHQEGTKHYEIRFANGASYSIPIVEEFEKDTDNDELINEGFIHFQQTPLYLQRKYIQH